MIAKLPKGFTHPMLIGEGAFASVYRARQTTLDRWVAIKIIREPELHTRQELLKEARVQARLDAPCVPQVYDAFEWHKNVCIVMQWIKGISLRTLLDEELSDPERKLIAYRIIEALASLHSSGYAHRDLKPANILIDEELALFLVDFGFTKNISDGQQSVVLQAKGTPAYMAPEIWKFGSNVDVMRADIFALGMILTNILNVKESFSDLLSENPEDRPANAAEVLGRIRNNPDFPVSSVGLGNRVRTKANDELSKALVTASKQLLFSHRDNEAYWLAVESLENDANNKDALVLIAEFSRAKKQGTFKKGYLLFAGAALLILCMQITYMVFSAHKKQEETEHGHETVSRVSSAVGRNKGTLVTEFVPLKSDSCISRSLTGVVMFSGLPAHYTLTIDKDRIDPSLREFHLIPGEHVLVIADTSGAVIWRERIKVLPFQSRTITFKQAGENG